MNIEVHKNQERDLNKNQIEVVESKKNEYRLIGQMRRQRGLVLFQYNVSNGELREVELSTQVVVGIDGKPHYRSKAKVESADMLYFWALNRKNAERKIKQLNNQK